MIRDVPKLVYLISTNLTLLINKSYFPQSLRVYFLVYTLCRTVIVKNFVSRPVVWPALFSTECLVSEPYFKKFFQLFRPFLVINRANIKSQNSRQILFNLAQTI